MYQHRDWQGALLDFPVGKVVCVGLNYAKHVAEMKSQASAEPLLFIKPETALCDLRQPVAIPKEFGEVHHETELAVLIGAPLKQASEDRCARAIAGFGVALDLTLRDVQMKLKAAGQPWEKSKAFDGAAPVSGFIPVNEFPDPQNVTLSLTVNNELRQQGNTREMLTPVIPLISYMSRYFTLRPGDIILTGTPEGVGPLVSGDMLKISVNDHMLTTRII
ncbi:fumarylacetoacetate hydrolase family protein [Morganella morganii]|jgi:2-keto-4-pentenoate hydratase/2-oxohepta-3-ene-1,7-dioic acid hydratase in catechol pathway|uniref:Fumarylacetoacetate hydrolase family protein n=1 Tax=Morganella morganii TaxID=582 RepID=A0AAN5MCF8_MORMO|nr:fumarylacetoacetate hydrolase family protein [Morganella morganii]ELA9087084.1 fumarylacetoacetate hydrolase family protein [Morganella morganii]MCU6376235.1 fumarylacetoacetate hydrolase family protein [Morganella morganii]HAT3807762.1 fumarylacetoacetate hydrolase family protein [Morganella morganii]HBH7051158.1 fumarylacetoacetate hydrolase family protein [Morganella morganii]HED3890486.1 fumarylacetoacetate hydrolase family protein [Morganella morganii]